MDLITFLVFINACSALAIHYKYSIGQVSCNVREYSKRHSKVPYFQGKTQVFPPCVLALVSSFKYLHLLQEKSNTDGFINNRKR